VYDNSSALTFSDLSSRRRRPTMSNIYVTEPPYQGKVILETNKGEIEIELFAKECPQTCKNFIALALEGYYDNLIWHRIVPDFIMQTGDPTGTGLGGESFYGESFSDEFHQRLRFNRRGLLGMANASQPNTNDSQFFLTLANTPELQARHTMFGRISNNTIYNLVNLAESAGEIGQDDRPAFPPKLRTIRVLENPFEGQIELRITKEEREEMKRNKRDAAKQRMERENAGAADGRKKKKNTSLLSFGEEESVQEEQTFKGPKSSHDLLKNDKRLRKEAAVRKAAVVTSTSEAPAGVEANGEERAEKRRKKEKKEESVVAQSDVQAGQSAKTKQSSSADKIAELEASLLGTTKVSNGDKAAKEKKRGKGKDLLQEYRDRYKKQAASSSGSSKKKDEATADLLAAFQKKLREGKETEAKKVPSREMDEEVPEDLREYGGSDDDDDTDWRSHTFDFGGKPINQDGHDNDDYVTLDPRDTTSSKAALLGFGGSEGAKRAKEERARDGRRGRDWVDPREDKERERRSEKGSRYQKSDTQHRREDDHPRPRSDVERW
jgi:peptidyl-prolyl cis-trans isomerase SDCCAG10